MTPSTEKEWIKRLSSPEEVIGLIQGTLGCGCPKEVFERYQVQLISSGHIPMVQLILGNRLLVWIIDGTKSEEIEKTASMLLNQGHRERDGQNLNRFRLVLVGHIPGPQATELLKLAESLDTKVHLHILPQL